MIQASLCLCENLYDHNTFGELPPTHKIDLFRSFKCEDCSGEGSPNGHHPKILCDEVIIFLSIPIKMLWGFAEINDVIKCEYK